MTTQCSAMSFSERLEQHIAVYHQLLEYDFMQDVWALEAAEPNPEHVEIAFDSLTSQFESIRQHLARLRHLQQEVPDRDAHSLQLIVDAAFILETKQYQIERALARYLHPPEKAEFLCQDTTAADWSFVSQAQVDQFEANLQVLPEAASPLIRDRLGPKFPLQWSFECEAQNGDPPQDRFVLEEVISPAQYGFVARSRVRTDDPNTDLQFPVVIKYSEWPSILQHRAADDPIREASIMARLLPLPSTLVSTLEFGCDAGAFWQVMEAQEENLLHCLARVGCFPERMARTLFVELLHALDHLHARCVAHRDVCLPNITLARRLAADSPERCDRSACSHPECGHVDVKLCDLGRAREFEWKVDEDDISYELPVHDPNYLPRDYCTSPETRHNELTLASQEDMFAAGTVLFSLLHGNVYAFDLHHGFRGYRSAAEVASFSRQLCQCNRCAELTVHFINQPDNVEFHSSCRMSHHAAQVLARLLCPVSMRYSVREIRCMSWFNPNLEL